RFNACEPQYNCSVNIRRFRQRNFAYIRIGRFGVKHKNGKEDFAIGFGLCYREVNTKSRLHVSQGYVMNRDDDDDDDDDDINVNTNDNDDEDQSTD
ncbi:uncharacterized protein Bfra_009484, partial [Botrytis fragariae]